VVAQYHEGCVGRVEPSFGAVGVSGETDQAAGSASWFKGTVKLTMIMIYLAKQTQDANHPAHHDRHILCLL
jgi:hypothetical protein